VPECGPRCSIPKDSQLIGFRGRARGRSDYMVPGTGARQDRAPATDHGGIGHFRGVPPKNRRTCVCSREIDRLISWGSSKGRGPMAWADFRHLGRRAGTRGGNFSGWFDRSRRGRHTFERACAKKKCAGTRDKKNHGFPEAAGAACAAGGAYVAKLDPGSVEQSSTNWAAGAMSFDPAGPGVQKPGGCIKQSVSGWADSAGGRGA